MNEFPKAKQANKRHGQQQQQQGSLTESGQSIKAFQLVADTLDVRLEIRGQLALGNYSERWSHNGRLGVTDSRALIGISLPQFQHLKKDEKSLSKKSSWPIEINNTDKEER